MMTLTEEEIGHLIRAGELSPSDLKKSEPDPPDPEDTTIKDGIAEIVKALKELRPKPMKDPLPYPTPQVTVQVPKHGTWSATVTERDKNGYIKRVAFTEVGA